MNRYIALRQVNHQMNRFLDTQKDLQRVIEHKKTQFQTQFEDMLSKSESLKFKAYDRVLPHIERFNNTIDRDLTFLDDSIAKIVDNVNKYKEGVRDIETLITEFMKEYNKSK